MEADRARAILRVGAQHDAYPGPIPEDDAQAVNDAGDLVKMAQEAWDQHVRNEAIESILNEAKNASENGDSPKPDPEPEPEAKPESEAKSEPEPEPESDESASLAQTEPWEDYDSDKVGDIIEGINVFVQEDQDVDSLLAHIWAYESAHKGRVRIINHLDKIAKERQGEEEQGEEDEPAPEAEGQGDAPDAAAHEAGTEGEDGAKEGSQDGEADGDGPEPEESDASDDTGGEADSEGQEDRDGQDAGEEAEEAGVEPAVEGDDEEHDLVADVRAELKRERLHTPPPIEEAPPEMPFDLTTVSDSELQRLYLMFAAYAYRTTHLLLLQEGSARRAKERADDLHRELLVASEKYDEHGKQKTMTVLEAEVEEDPEVKRWRRIQRKYETFAQSYRAERDSYYKFVDALSRLETMRDNEFERAGGQRSGGRRK